MTSGDLLGLFVVYIYVFLVLLASENIFKNNSLHGRKFLHIMVGNIIFILPLFETRMVIVFLAAAPFIVLTFLISPYSPIDLMSKTSAKGHSLGLVYYSISWTVLAFVFFNNLEVIAIGIVAMSYGDGFASLIGKKFGKTCFVIWGDTKSIEGSLSMFLATFLMMIVALIFFNRIPNNLIIIPLVALIATVAEAFVPKGLDNLSCSLIAAIFYYIFVYGV